VIWIKELVKSPMNYVGGKYKLLHQIIPYMPEGVDKFIDLFTGGCNVGVNVEAEKIICNDKTSEIINLLKGLKETDREEAIKLVKETIEKYKLSKENAEGYKLIREDYNKGNREWYIFYSMIAHSFNHQIRFNSKGEFNMPFGKSRSWFNPNLEKNFIKFVDRLHNIDIEFKNYDFRDLIKELELTEDSLVYCDPPYINTLASYNEGRGWTLEDEKDLLDLLDDISSRGVRFMLSNVLEHNGIINERLLEWSKKYNTYDLNYSYSNSNYQKKNRGKSREVLITNYIAKPGVKLRFE